MDILFKNDDFVFSYRVGGILIRNGKILLQRPKDDDYSIIGGHVAAMETSIETLKREFEEELHTKIEVDNLLAIGEIYFPWGKRPCHQICLYYNVHLVNYDIPLDGVFHGYDGLDDKRIDLDFCWVPLEDLKNDVKVYPQVKAHATNTNSSSIPRAIGRKTANAERIRALRSPFSKQPSLCISSERVSAFLGSYFLSFRSLSISMTYCSSFLPFRSKRYLPFSSIFLSRKWQATKWPGSTSTYGGGTRLHFSQAI